MFRDLKPQNVGLDFNGRAKIFDFGLAKELKEKDQVGPDQFKASQMTGTRRCMAQEVYFGKPYGLSPDVYSFALLMWEVVALKVPFARMDSCAHSNISTKRSADRRSRESGRELSSDGSSKVGRTSPSLAPP